MWTKIGQIMAFITNGINWHKNDNSDLMSRIHFDLTSSNFAKTTKSLLFSLESPLMKFETSDDGVAFYFSRLYDI